jgi:hypothetical protein
LIPTKLKEGSSPGLLGNGAICEPSKDYFSMASLQGPTIDLTELSDDESCTKRQRTSHNTWESIFDRVVQLVPHATMEAVRSILSHQPNGMSEEDSINGVVDVLFANEASLNQEEADRELALAITAADEDVLDQSAMIMNDEALAISICKQEAEARDRQLAQNLEEQSLASFLQTSQQPLSACKNDAASVPTYREEELSGASDANLDLLDCVAKRINQEAAKFKHVQGQREVFICADVRFFGSTFTTVVVEDDEANPQANRAWEKRREGDIGWGCGYRNIQVC